MVELARDTVHRMIAIGLIYMCAHAFIVEHMSLSARPADSLGPTSLSLASWFIYETASDKSYVARSSCYHIVELITGSDGIGFL